MFLLELGALPGENDICAPRPGRNSWRPHPLFFGITGSKAVGISGNISQPPILRVATGLSVEASAAPCRFWVALNGVRFLRVAKIAS